MERSFSFWAFSLDRVTVQHTLHLVQFWPPIGNVVVRSSGKSWGHSPTIILEESILNEVSKGLCFAHLPFLYQLSNLPLSSTKLFALVQVLFSLLWLPSDGGLELHGVQIHQHILCISFLDWMCVQTNENGKFWNHFWLWQMCTCVKRMPGVCPETSAYSIANAKMFLWATTGLSDTKLLLWKTLYQVLVMGDCSWWFDGWQSKNFAPFGLEHSGWNASIILKHHSPG